MEKDRQSMFSWLKYRLWPTFRWSWSLKTLLEVTLELSARLSCVFVFGPKSSGHRVSCAAFPVSGWVLAAVLGSVSRPAPSRARRSVLHLHVLLLCLQFCLQELPWERGGIDHRCVHRVYTRLFSSSYLLQLYKPVIGWEVRTLSEMRVCCRWLFSQIDFF